MKFFTLKKENYIIVNDLPIINQLENIFYDVGDTGNIISLLVFDSISDICKYIICLDGEIYNTGTWISGIPIEISIDGLEIILPNYISYGSLAGCQSKFIHGINIKIKPVLPKIGLGSTLGLFQ